MTADNRLSGVEINLTRMQSTTRIATLNLAFSHIYYDYVLLDLPSSMGLIAANEVLIPAKPEYLGVKALLLLVDMINNVKTKYKPRLGIIGILPTFNNPHYLHHAMVIQAWKDAKQPVLDITVRQSAHVAEAPIKGLSIVDFEPDSPINNAYYRFSEITDQR